MKSVGKIGHTPLVCLLAVVLLATGTFALAPVVNGARGIADIAILAIALACCGGCAWLLARSRGLDDRLSRAIDATTSNVMVTDRKNNVIYANCTAQALTAAVQAGLHDTLAGLTGTHTAEMRLGGATMKIIANPVLDADGRRMGSVVEWVDRTAELALEETTRARTAALRTAAMESARIRQALDAATANVMVADETGTILYMNRTARQLMLSAQADFQQVMPHFDAAALIGARVSLFDPVLATQRVSLASLEQAFSAELTFGASTMRIIANPIFDDAGKRLGTVAEWGDRTQEVAVQVELQHVVSEVLKGNLEQRIALEGKQGYIRDLSTDINALVENMAAVVGEVQSLVAAVNDGNLERRIRTGGRSGLTVKLGSGINELTANVAAVVDEVQELVRAANEGDINRRIQTEGKSGLMVKMATGINQLTTNLAGMVSQVKYAAEEVNRGADEITTGNATLSQRMEEQASSLEETASSMEEMTSTVRQNAENAGQANQLAVAARDQAEKGGAVVSRAVQAMAEINQASRKIADIIGVIDEIAFQTNLLALNAAVEAARAGEQGRGFAVVATEVRNLAGRSATAAKEIKALINDSVQKVQDGSTLVTQSGATLEQIVAAVKKVTDIVAEIAAASHEQSAGIEQVNRAVMQLDDLTQQNAALVEQASASSLAMAGQARSLNELMRHYNVEARRAHDAGDQPTPAVPPQNVERRKAGRPWSRATTAAGAEPGASDAVWKEF
ncbi:MAG TPA: methyl-accepting chemotaxis protein [Steroidobacteraceae bacterium]|nr:methyl-accepting chemotaxis protein [Steroidobacteraceae bacterium]